MEKTRGRAVSPGDRLLKIYFRDHLAASVGISGLTARCLENNRTEPLGRFLETLDVQLQEDRKILKDLLERLGGIEDPIKSSGAWLLEKMGRLKMNGKVLGYSDLSRLEELEALSLGLLGKLALWTVMEEMARADPRFSGIDFSALREKALRQQARVEEYRMTAARLAFGQKQE